MELKPTPGSAVIALSEVQREKSALSPAPAPAPTPEVKAAQQQVKEAVEQIQRNIAAKSTDLRFTVDKATGKTIVSIVDSQTQEVVRQIPTEEIMKLARWIDRMQGLLVNGKA
jgi:flagellar protein FlaG